MVVMFSERFGEFEPGETVRGTDAPDDARTFEHQEVPVG